MSVQEDLSPIGLANFFQDTPTSIPLTPIASTPRAFSDDFQVPMNVRFYAPELGSPPRTLPSQLPQPDYGPVTPQTPRRGTPSPMTLPQTPLPKVPMTPQTPIRGTPSPVRLPQTPSPQYQISSQQYQIPSPQISSPQYQIPSPQISSPQIPSQQYQIPSPQTTSPQIPSPQIPSPGTPSPMISPQISSPQIPSPQYQTPSPQYQTPSPQYQTPSPQIPSPQISSPQISSSQISSPQTPSPQYQISSSQTTSPQIPSPQTTSPQISSFPRTELPTVSSFRLKSPTSVLPSPPQSRLPLILPTVSPITPQSVPPKMVTSDRVLPSISSGYTPRPPLPTTSKTVFPSITMPSVTQPILKLNTFGTYIPTILEDNETGDLRWDRPDRPQPAEMNSFYRRVGCIADGSCFFHGIAKGLSGAYQSSYREPSATITEDTLQNLEGAVNHGILFSSSLFTEPRNKNLSTVYTVRPTMYQTFDNLMNKFRYDYVKILRHDFANKILTENRMQEILEKRFDGRINMEYSAIVANANEERIRRGLEPLDVNVQTNRLVHLEQDQYVYKQALQIVKEQLAQELLSEDAVQPDFMLILSDYVGVDIYLLREQDLANPNPRVTPLYGGSSLHMAVQGPRNRRSIVLIGINDYHYEVVARVDQNETNLGILRYIHPNMGEEEPLIRQLYQMLTDIREQDLG